MQENNNKTKTNTNISIPVNNIIIDKDGKVIEQKDVLTPILVNTECINSVYSPKNEDSKFISSIQYLPDFLQDKPVFKDAAKLLDVLITDADDETLKEINQAFCDTLYKYSGYDKLSYGAKITFLQERGFDYVLDLLLHMYDDDYNVLVSSYRKGEVENIPTYEEFVKQRADERLTKLVTLFNFINVLKGKTIGLELVLRLVDMPEFLYMPWNVVANFKGEWEDSVNNLPMPNGAIPVKAGDCYSKTVGNTVNYYIYNGVSWHQTTNYYDYLTPREPITAVLDVYGVSSQDLQKRLANFTRHYMLPIVHVTLKFTAEVPSVLAFPSGIFELFKLYQYYDYYDMYGTRYQKELVHKVSDEHWYYSDTFNLCPVTFGIPVGVEDGQAFGGSVDLTKSYVEDAEGVKHYLYGSEPTLHEAIGGTATDRMNSDGIINNYDDIYYLQVPMEDYIELDFVTGNQMNPYYDENGVFCRDTFIYHCYTLLIENIHLVKTVEQMMGLLVEDFDKIFNEGEVWLGMSTTVDCLSGKDYREDFSAAIDEQKEKYQDELLSKGIPQRVIDEYADLCKTYKNGASYYHRYLAKEKIDEYDAQYPDLKVIAEIPYFFTFEYIEPDIRPETGAEDIHLIFCEAEVEDDCYTGIGDLGILGVNDYFLYNGMLMYHGETKLQQVGDSKAWTDVGASHAVSEMYYTPAICNGKLYYLYKGVATLIPRNEDNLSGYTEHIIEHPQVIVDEMEEDDTVNTVDREPVRSFETSWIELDKDYWDSIESMNWTHVTGYINNFYNAFGICDGRLYLIGVVPDQAALTDDEVGNEDDNDDEEDINPDIVDPSKIKYTMLSESQQWTYITGVDYSETYEAYGICNEKLYRITADGINEIKISDIQHIVGIEGNVELRNNNDSISVEFTAYHRDGSTGKDTIELFVTERIENEETVKEVSQIKFNGEAIDFTVEDNNYTSTDNSIEIYYEVYNNSLGSIFIDTPTYHCDMYFSDNIPYSYNLNQQENIVGWDSSFDCISRYHHCNSEYTTYGICKGILYSINNDNVKVLDDSRVYTSICGYYNDNSPRTFAYVIDNEGKLYEVKGNTIDLKDDTRYWTEIHGCSTATNNYIIGIAKNNKEDETGYIYKVNAKSISKLDESDGWTKCFGRYTTSKSPSSFCYGYGVRNGKLYQFTNEKMSIVSGFWKREGVGEIVELKDYNIKSVTMHLEDEAGTELVGEQAIKEVAPIEGTVLSDYDIYITYTTRGFNNNTRYIIRTERTETNFTYVHPEECREDVSEEHSYDLFDTNTGTITRFISRNFTINGTDIVDGNGDAIGFLAEKTYISLPTSPYWETFTTYIKFSCNINSTNAEIFPVILDENGYGIYYGSVGTESGVFTKSSNGEYRRIAVISELDEYHTYEVKHTKVNGHCDISITDENGVFTTPFISTSDNYIDIPCYLGGNGTDFGDAIIHLNGSYIMTTGEEINRVELFEKGKYFSVDSQRQNIIEDITTSTTQNISKVIEVIKENGEVLEFSMDTLYTQMIPTCPTNDLMVSTDFNYNRIQTEPYEGTSYATITYSGAFTLDPDKITSNVPLNTVCDFDNTGVAENLNKSSNDVTFKLNTDVTTPIYVTTGNNVERQGLYRTEEDSAFTNDYLLQSIVTLDYSDVKCRAVPNGIVYELYSNAPQVETRTLVYNNEAFSLDNNKITDYYSYAFDSYEATLTFSRSYTFDESDITHDNPLYTDDWCNIRLNVNETKDADNVITSHVKLRVISSDDEQNDIPHEKFMMIDKEEFRIPNEVGIADDYYYNIDVTKQFVDINRSFLDEIDPAIEEKDKLQYMDGQAWNFSLDSYFKFKDNNNITELVLCLLTDDDTSKDQGIFGNADNLVGFGIKDNMWTYTDINGVATKSDEIARDNAYKYIRFLKNQDGKTVNIYATDSVGLIESISDEEDEGMATQDQSIYWTELFTNVPISSNLVIGYASVQGELLPYNGTIDLAQSYVVYNSNTAPVSERLYDMLQNTKVYGSKTADGNFTLLKEIITPYAVFEINMGYEFTGKLDCYYSELLLSYDLGWIEDRINISDVIKTEISRFDNTYNPALDDTIYDILEYGIYLEEEPKRWDTITVTYTTEDKAYYLEPNTSYIFGMEVEEDKEAGKLLVGTVGTPAWSADGGILSDFNNGYCTYDFTTEEYMVLKLCNSSSSSSSSSSSDSNNLEGVQAICGYIDENEIDTKAQCIFIDENNILKYFDDINEHELIPLGRGKGRNIIPNGKDYYLKIYMNEHDIEYSLDGENFISTGVSAAFTGYERFAIGNGFVREALAPYKGKIYIKESYIQTGEDKTYLFKHYKKITPYVITPDDGVRHDIVITPLLTIRDYVEFAYDFDGSMDLYRSGLLLEDSKYWSANQISIYDKETGALRDTIIRDSLNIGDEYIVENKTVRVNPESLYVRYMGDPKIGSQIVLTYDTWYLFRERNTEYNFKINYLLDSNGNYSDRVTITYTKAPEIIEGEFGREDTVISYPEYTLYITDLQDLTLNTGFEFNGTLDVYNSTRGGMRLCDHRIWETFIIKYRKYDSDPNTWDIWGEFIRENTHMLYQRMGYELKGYHNLSTSWFKAVGVESPFVTYYNSYYIVPVGNLSFTTEGVVSSFSPDAYLAVVMDHIDDGYTVSFNMHTGEYLYDQGISTWVKALGEEFISDDGDPLSKFRPDYTYIVQYIFGSYGLTVSDVDVMSKANLDETLNKYFLEAGGTITVRIMGYNIGEINYTPTKSNSYSLTVIPYNPNRSEGSTGYYVTDIDQVNSIIVEYRKGEKGYDHFTGEGEDTWYKVNLTRQNIEYCGKQLNVYAVTIPFGYNKINDTDNNTTTLVNTNPDGVEYNNGDTIEVKITSDTVTYLTAVPYNNLIKKQRAIF